MSVYSFIVLCAWVKKCQGQTQLQPFLINPTSPIFELMIGNVQYHFHIEFIKACFANEYYRSKPHGMVCFVQSFLLPLLAIMDQWPILLICKYVFLPANSELLSPLHDCDQYHFFVGVVLVMKRGMEGLGLPLQSVGLSFLYCAVVCLQKSSLSTIYTSRRFLWLDCSLLYFLNRGLLLLLEGAAI